MVCMIHKITSNYRRLSKYITDENKVKEQNIARSKFNDESDQSGVHFNTRILYTNCQLSGPGNWSMWQ